MPIVYYMFRHSFVPFACRCREYGVTHSNTNFQIIFNYHGLQHNSFKSGVRTVHIDFIGVMPYMAGSC